jgi:hypothetical protein
VDGRLSMRNNIDLSHIDSAALDRVLPIALARGVEHLRGVAVERAPIETGHLRASASPHVESGDRASLTFPGPYARYQEFTLDLRHEQGQALYLTSTMISERGTALGIVAQTLKTEL